VGACTEGVVAVAGSGARLFGLLGSVVGACTEGVVAVAGSGDRRFGLL
jgi:hypothetical protein